MTSIICLGATDAVASTKSASDALEQAVEDALNDWSQFARTGDLTSIDNSFFAGGPQRAQFEAESLAWEGTSGSAPLRLEARHLRLRRVASGTATMWAEIEASRVGYQREVLSWDFDLINDDGRWLVWTVIPAESSPVEVSAAQPASPITVTEPSAPIMPTESNRTEAAPATSSGGLPGGIRLPAISAWIIVITLVGIAVAGYLAPRIDKGARRGER